MDGWFDKALPLPFTPRAFPVESRSLSPLVALHGARQMLSFLFQDGVCELLVGFVTQVSI